MKDLLIDRHAFLWFNWHDPNLRPTARTLIEHPANRKLVSVATCWEIAVRVPRTNRDKTVISPFRLGHPASCVNLCGCVIIPLT